VASLIKPLRHASCDDRQLTGPSSFPSLHIAQGGMSRADSLARGSLLPAEGGAGQGECGASFVLQPHDSPAAC
jgi:hypothetical protein